MSRNDLYTAILLGLYMQSGKPLDYNTVNIGADGLAVIVTYATYQKSNGLYIR